MKGPRRLSEDNELVAKLFADARNRRPPPEALDGLLVTLDSLPTQSVAPAARSDRLAFLRTRAPWLCLAIATVGSLAWFGAAQDRSSRTATSTIPAERRDVAPPAPTELPSEFTARQAEPDALRAPSSEAAPSVVPMNPAPEHARVHAQRPSVIADRTALAKHEAAHDAAPETSHHPSNAPRASMRHELELITGAREALARHDTEACVATLTRHDAEFPHGQFTPEADVMRIEAAVAGGRREAARRLATTFLTRNPGSPYAERVRSLVEAQESE